MIWTDSTVLLHHVKLGKKFQEIRDSMSAQDFLGKTSKKYFEQSMYHQHFQPLKLI